MSSDNFTGQAAVEAELGYRFRDAGLLVQAMTHPSHPAAVRGARDFERLEFLGDSVLGMVVAELVFEMYPDEREGDLAKRKALLVSKETLAGVAAAWGVEKHLRIVLRETRYTGRRSTEAVLENACEALVGAVFLDGGVGAARELIRRVWEPIARESKEPPKDARTALQEWAQGRGLPLPEYAEVGRKGSAHAPEFVIEVVLPGFDPCRASGKSKKQAAAEAAALLLAMVEKNGG